MQYFTQGNKASKPLSDPHHNARSCLLRAQRQRRHARGTGTSESRSSPLPGWQPPLRASSGAGDQLQPRQLAGCHRVPPLLCCAPGRGGNTAARRNPHGTPPSQAGHLPATGHCPARRPPHAAGAASSPAAPLSSLCSGPHRPGFPNAECFCSASFPAAAFAAAQLGDLAALPSSSSSGLHISCGSLQRLAATLP